MSKSNSKPSHDVYAVVERKGQKSNWTKVGACWGHEDGKGYSMKLEFLPLTGASYVIRIRTDKPEQTTAQEGGAA